MGADVFVDASVFMGMHSRDEAMRVACKSVFVERLEQGVVMSLEQVGRCDDLVWRHAREVQDAYYPFMDRLQSDMPFERVPYDERDLRTALHDHLPERLPAHERLLLAMVVNRGGTLYSISPRLRGHPNLPVRAPRAGREPCFPDDLERLYRESLRLRVGGDVL